MTLEERAHQYWHGDGQNRFFDKPLQYIVNDNGTSGFMGEHSMMDGTPTHRLNDYANMVIFNNKLDFSNPDVSDQWGTANAMNEFVAQRSFNDPDKGLFVAPPV